MHDSPPPMIIQLKHLIQDVYNFTDDSEVGELLETSLELIESIIEFHPSLIKDAKGQLYKE